MGVPMLSTWIYLAVAAAMAVTAFAIGQFVPGMGAPFAALATTLWVAYSVARRRKA